MQAPFEAAQEPIQFPAAPIIRDELPYRLRQQSLLGEFGRIAMQTRDFRRILQRATELCAQGLQARFAKVLEYEPDQKRLVVRAGVGWAPDTIDIVSVAADLGSPAGYAYQTGESVISNHRGFVIEPEAMTIPADAKCKRLNCRELRAEGYQVGDRFHVLQGADYCYASKSGLSSHNQLRRQAIEAMDVLEQLPGATDHARLRVGLDCKSAAIAAKILAGEHIGSHAWRAAPCPDVGVAL